MAEMTTLAIAQEFCSRQGLPRPTTVVSAQDDTTQQVLGLMNEGMQDLCDRYLFQGLRRLITFNHAGATGYAALKLSNYPDWKSFIAGTLWDQTSRLPVLGPIGEQQWTTITTMLIAPARYSFRLYGDFLRIFPAPSPLNSILFRVEYDSRYGVYNPSTSKYTEFFTTDESYSVLPNNVVLADLKWRWRQAKGLPYAEDQRTAEEAVANLIAREPQQEIRMDGTEDGRFVGPGLFVAAGSWNLP